MFSASKLKINRKLGVSKRPSVISGSEKTKPAERPPVSVKKELQKSTPKIAKEYIDSRWPKVKVSSSSEIDVLSLLFLEHV